MLNVGKEWAAAEVKHDAATVRRILDDKFVATWGVKGPLDKEAYLKEVLGENVDPAASQTLTDETVVLDGDTAVVLGTDTARGTENGATYTAVLRYTVTYVRRNARWVALAEHIVEVPLKK